MEEYRSIRSNNLKFIAKKADDIVKKLRGSAQKQTFSVKELDEIMQLMADKKSSNSFI
jgi:hypothetical protein